MEDKPLSRAQRLYIALGPLLFALVVALLPASLFELGREWPWALWSGWAFGGSPCRLARR